MPLVPAKCTSCGGTLEVDSAQQAAICKYCGSAFVVEQAINNYNVTNVTNIASLNAGVVNLNSGESADELSNRADTFVSLKEFGRADECYAVMREKFPADPRGWAGKIRIKTLDYYQFTISLDFLEECINMYDKFLSVSKQKGSIDKETARKIEMVIDQLIAALEKSYKSLEDGRLAELKKISDDTLAVSRSFDKSKIDDAKKQADARYSVYNKFHKALIAVFVLLCAFIAIFDLSRFDWIFARSSFFNSLREVEIGVGVIIKPVVFFGFSIIAMAIIFGVGYAIDGGIYSATAYNSKKRADELEEEYKKLETDAVTKAAEYAVELVPHEKNVKRLNEDKEVYSKIKQA